MNFKALSTPIENLADSYDVIVVGSGIAGMSAATALQKKGKSVLLLEQHYVPGGLTHTFQRKGFKWDVGVHCLGDFSASSMNGRMMDYLTDGHPPQFQSMGEFYEKYLFNDGEVFDVPSNLKTYIQKLKERFPEEADSIDRYFDLVKQAAHQGTAVFSKRVLPKWAKALIGPERDHYWRVSTIEVMRGLFKNARLIQILTGQWGYCGSHPRESSFGIHAAIVNHYLKGGYYPVSTAESFAQSILANFIRQGGTLGLRAEVSKWILEDHAIKGVILKTGKSIRSKKTISAMGAKQTAMMLGDDPFHTEWKNEVLKLKNSPPYLCLYIGYEAESLEKLGISRENHWFYHDFDQVHWNLVEPLPPVTYISFPSIKDPNHHGKLHTAEMITFTDYQFFEKWKETRRGHRDSDYLELKKEIESKLIHYFKERFPMIADQIKHYELATPLSMEFFTRSHQGAIYGLASTLDRYINPCLDMRTPYRNLLLTGQDSLTPGVVGGMTSGIMTASLICPSLFLKLL